MGGYPVRKQVGPDLLGLDNDEVSRLADLKPKETII